MYGFRSIQAPLCPYLATSSGPTSIATSGAVLLLMARWTSSSPLPPVTLTVIHGVALCRSARLALKVSSSLPVKNVHTLNVTGSCVLFWAGVLLLVVAAHAVMASTMASTAVAATASRIELRLRFIGALRSRAFQDRSANLGRCERLVCRISASMGSATAKSATRGLAIRALNAADL